MLEAGAMITSEAWLCDYEKRYEQAREEWKKLVLEETNGLRIRLTHIPIIRSVSRREERLQNRTLPGQGWQFMC